MVKKLLSVVLVILLIGLFITMAGCENSVSKKFRLDYPDSSGKEVMINEPNTLDPASVTIKQGQEMTWVNHDTAAHDLVSEDGSAISSGPIQPKEIFPMTFYKKGTIKYHCKIHPQMQGTVIVQ